MPYNEAKDTSCKEFTAPRHSKTRIWSLGPKILLAKSCPFCRSHTPIRQVTGTPAKAPLELGPSNIDRGPRKPYPLLNAGTVERYFEGLTPL
jgi:hypothetical protein